MNSLVWGKSTIRRENKIMNNKIDQEKFKDIYFEGKPMEEHIDGQTFNVCYLREYMDPEHEGEFFYAYETVYRNVPRKFKHIFTDKVKLKIVKFLIGITKKQQPTMLKSQR